MTTETKLTEREEIETLLPWFVTGKLTDKDQARVTSYLASHADMSAQLALIRDELDETISANEALPSAPGGALGRLMASVEAEKRGSRTLASSLTHQASGQARSLWAQLGELFTTPSPLAVRYAMAAAALVIMAQAVLVGTLISSRGPSAGGPGYETASGPASPVTVGTRLLVQFKPNATASDISSMIEGLGAEIVAGPRPGGMFILRISEKVLALEEKNAIIAKLKTRADLVAIVLPTE